MTRNSSKLAIAILNYKMPHLADSMISQLSDSRRYDVFLFDNGGMGYLYPGINVISWVKNLMFTANWNRAMMYLGDYDYVWMLNDDLEGVSQGMADGLMGYFSPSYAAVTPAFNSPHPVFHQRYPPGMRRVSWVDWCCPVVNMRAWQDVGPFDECFVGYGADLDWCRRARQKGWWCWVADDFEVRHLGSVTALRHGLQSTQGDVQAMNELLKKKWGVKDWSEMVWKT